MKRCFSCNKLLLFNKNKRVYNGNMYCLLCFNLITNNEKSPMGQYDKMMLGLKKLNPEIKLTHTGRSLIEEPGTKEKSKEFNEYQNPETKALIYSYVNKYLEDKNNDFLKLIEYFINEVKNKKIALKEISKSEELFDLCTIGLKISNGQIKLHHQLEIGDIFVHESQKHKVIDIHPKTKGYVIQNLDTGKMNYTAVEEFDKEYLSSEKAYSSEYEDSIKIFLQDYINLYNVLFKKNIRLNLNSLFDYFDVCIKENIQESKNKIIEDYLKIFKTSLSQHYNDYNIVKLNLIREWQMLSGDLMLLILRKINNDNTIEIIYYTNLLKKVKADIFEYKLLTGISLIKSLDKFYVNEDFELLDGREFEIFLENIFIKLGYEVKQTPLTGDQGADLIIRKDNITTVIQAKKYSAKVSNSAIQEIVGAKGYYKADKMIVITNNDFTASAIELANRNNVELWNGSILKEKISNTISKNTEFTSTLERKEDKLVISCPNCKYKFEIDFIEDMKEFKTKCPNCFLGIEGSQN